MSENSWRPNAEAKPLTESELLVWADDLFKRDLAMDMELGERGRAFMEYVPESLHNHPTIVNVLGIITSGMPVHPDQKKAMQEEVERLIAEARNAGSTNEEVTSRLAREMKETGRGDTNGG